MTALVQFDRQSTGGRTAMREFRHRDDLQGLRAVAVLLVVLNHAGVRGFGGGYVGVDVFFVLSGFVITGLLLREAADGKGISISQFYVRRAKRILPAATLTLIATDLAAYHFLNVVRAKQVISDSVWATFFSVNWHFAHVGTDYFARANPPSPVQHFWTLSVEEQFYLVWPTLLALVAIGLSARSRSGHQIVSRSRRRVFRRALALTLLVGGASLAWSIASTRAEPTAAYFSTLTRAWELGLGALLALLATRVSVAGAARTVAGWLGLVLIVATGALFSAGTTFPGYAALAPTLGAVLVICGGVGGATRFGVDRLLSLLPLRFVGDRSYTLYLWHWPILIIAAEHAGHSLSVLENLALAAAAFGLSIVTYAVFENPLRRLDWSRQGAAFAVTGAATLMVIASGWMIQSIDSRIAAASGPAAPVAQLDLGGQPPTATNGQALGLGGLADAEAAAQAPALPAVSAEVRLPLSTRVPASVSPPLATLPQSHYVVRGGCVATSDQATSSKICHLGDVGASRTLVVIGDSHAMMWMPDILAFATAQHYQVVPLIKYACTPAAVYDDSWGHACAAWVRWAARRAAEEHPSLTILAGFWSFLGEQATQPLVAGLNYLASHTRSPNVVVIGDAPGLDRQPVDCLLAAHATIRRCTTTWTTDRLTANRTIAGAAGTYRFVDTTGWFCAGLVCPMVVGNVVVYADGNHITTDYATALSHVFNSALTAALRKHA